MGNPDHAGQDRSPLTWAEVCDYASSQADSVGSIPFTRSEVLVG
jgi:hypothetical protein